MILSNIVQNAVKFNTFYGIIMIIIDCYQQDIFDKKYVFETRVIDTGIGIEKSRQQMLFVPFLELKIKQNMEKVKDNSIGVGLASS